MGLRLNPIEPKQNAADNTRCVKGYQMSKYYLFLLIFLIFIGCGTDEAPPNPTGTFDYATVVEVKVTKTFKGDDADHLWWDRQGLKYWHSEIDIVFSQTPMNLDVFGVSATHFNIGNHVNNGFAGFDWEQTGNTGTIHLTFHASPLFHGNIDYAPLSYESAKETYPDIDWDNFTAYTIDFTLDWDTGRKRFDGIPIKPAQQILDRFRASKE